jgi:hypothetical protein
MAAVTSSLIQSLPSGTAYCIGIVLIVMGTGRLMQHKGSLARAALPGVAASESAVHRAAGSWVSETSADIQGTYRADKQRLL